MALHIVTPNFLRNGVAVRDFDFGEKRQDLTKNDTSAHIEILTEPLPPRL